MSLVDVVIQGRDGGGSDQGGVFEVGCPGGKGGNVTGFSVDGTSSRSVQMTKPEALIWASLHHPPKMSPD